MVTVKELEDWLRDFAPDEHVGIDDGGLALRLEECPEYFFEIGGISDEAEDQI